MSEARTAFLAALRAGLRDLPSGAVDDIVRDYASHFDVGAAKGRTDEEISAALGDPLQLADELRVEMRISHWKERRTPGAGVKLVASILGLGVLNIALVFIAAPILFLLGFILIVTVAACIVTGIWLILAAPGLDPAPAFLPLSLAGAGLIAAAIALSALAALVAIGLVSALARYARLHYRILSRQPGGVRA